MTFKNLHILEHPLIQQKLFYLRDKRTNNLNFRTMLNEISGLMVYEVTRNFPVRPREVETPLEKTTGYVLAKSVILVPILRAGLAMSDGILRLIPHAKVGHLGLYRDKETLKPVEYYRKFPPDIADSEIMVIDPMLATGGSAVAAIDFVKKAGGKSIKFICLVAAPEGVQMLEEHHPDVPIFTAALDRELNDHKYILPGLGDAGDRIYGTE
ncbi:MAG TPA: uracil phosphoribosyltransferase [Caldithrix abyssi]|uniref:Uracil phosphoribosyltransferase n=1 Tax=Caldithrix abyssi TaxID=187145 RepID=A0A7V5PMI4_CALAY|nr:uracil phosphoribosyltransferase [Caldithrix abyssi]